MHQHGQYLFAMGVCTAVHAGPHRAFDHRVDNFQVRRVKRERQRHRAAARADVRAKALVVLHIAGGQVFWSGVIELCEQVFGHLAQRVDEHVQTATMGHANHDFLDTLFTRRVDQLIHCGNEALATFQRETLLADVFGMQKALQAFGSCQAIQNALFSLGTEVGLAADAFEFLLPPAFLVLVGGIHEFGADGAAIGFVQRVEQLTQRHFFFAEEGIAGIKNGFQVGIAEAVERGFQLRNRGALSALERIQIGPALAHVAVGGNELLHRCALAAHLGIDTGHNHLGATRLGALGKGIDDRHVGHVLGIAAIHCRHVLQGIEILAPRVGYATGVG